MKLIRDKTPLPRDTAECAVADTQCAPVGVPRISTKPSLPWKILVVDDEPEIHAVTKLSVGDLEFEQKGVELLSAMSGEEARGILMGSPDIAVALIDVVMETEDAGLRLVDYIRNQLNNQRIRIIIRTGQPGVAPERYVIDHYDIDDYKEKTELTTQRLYTTLRTTLKAYRDLTIIDNNRQGLEKILAAAPNLYRIQPMEQFLEGVLLQVTNICHIGESSLMATVNGVLAILKGDSKVAVLAGTGKFANKSKVDTLVDNIIKACESIVLGNKFSVDFLPKNSLLLPMAVYGEILGFIYLEEVSFLTNNDRNLLQIMTTQCAAALKNISIYSTLEEANRQNEQKNRFLGMAAHDLRAPIHVIQGFSDLLRTIRADTLDHQQLEFISMIRKSSGFMLRLVDDLLDVAKIESGKLELKMERENCVAIADEAISFNRHLANSKQIQLVLISDGDLPHIRVDAEKIQRVLNNFISNAIKFSPPQTRVEVRVTKTENAFIFSVKDEGQGIPEHELGKLFQPFSKTSVTGTAGEKGTGLGLLICRKIIEAHRGNIWVESQPGAGSTFYCSLNIAPGE